MPITKNLHAARQSATMSPLEFVLCAVIWIYLGSAVLPARVRRNAGAVVNILIVVDTESLREDFAATPPSQDPYAPSEMPERRVFMIAPEKYVLRGQATAQLNHTYLVGGTVRWFGISETNDLDTTVIVYDINQSYPVFDEAKLKIIEGSSVVPLHPDDAGDVGMLPRRHTFLSATGIRGAKEYVKYSVYVAVYTTSRHGPQLFGYFKWDPYASQDW